MAVLPIPRVHPDSRADLHVHPVDTTSDDRPGQPVPTPRPAATATAGPAKDRTRDRDTGYRHLEPVLVAFAATEPHDRDRPHLREQLLVGYLPVARNIARRYAGRGEPLEDLEQVGAVGLLNAIDRFDPERGYPFLAYAVPTITGAIRRHFRDTTWSMRVPRRLKDLHGAMPIAVDELSTRLHRAPRPSEIAAHLNVSTADVLEAFCAARAYRPRSLDTASTPQPDAPALTNTLGHTEPRFEQFTESHSLAPHLAALPPRERRIMIMRFYQDMTQTQIAEKIGISQMHVSRLLSATLTALRDAVDTPPATPRPRPPRPAIGGRMPAVR